MERKTNFSTNISLLILAICGFLVYSFSFNNEFVLDDRSQIVVNSSVHSIRTIPSLFLSSTFFKGGSEKSRGTYYRPLMMSVFTILYSLSGENPFGFHLFQVTLHVINACLLFLLFRKYFNQGVALLLGLIFVLHPMNVESVVYIADIQDVLFLFFGLCSIHLIIRFSHGLRLKHPQIWLFFLFLLTLLSKESGVLFGVVITAYLLLNSPKKVLQFVKPLIIALGFYILLKNAAMDIFPPKNSVIPIMNASLGTRLQTMPRIITHYLTTYIYPKNIQVFSIWLVEKITVTDFIIPLAFVCFVIFVLVGAKWYLNLKKDSDHATYTFFLVWFASGLLLHAQIIPLDATVADRWFYFTQIGLLGMIGVFISRMYKRIEVLPSAFVLLPIVLLGFLTMRTVDRIHNWSTEYTLVSNDIQISRDNHLLENALGYNLMKRKSYDEAIVHLTRATQLSPQWNTPFNTLGYVYELKGDLESRKMAYTAYERSYALRPDFLTIANLTRLMIEDKRYVAALGLLEDGVSRYPHNPQLWYFLSVSYQAVGNTSLAQEAQRRFFQLVPKPSDRQTFYVIRE